MTVIDSYWYGNIGIVKTYTPYMGVRFYIGTGKGLNQKEDEKWIAQWGNHFNPDDPFFKRVTGVDNDKRTEDHSRE